MSRPRRHSMSSAQIGFPHRSKATSRSTFAHTGRRSPFVDAAARKAIKPVALWRSFDGFVDCQCDDLKYIVLGRLQYLPVNFYDVNRVASFWTSGTKRMVTDWRYRQ